jgi:hypothetical protein
VGLDWLRGSVVCFGEKRVGGVVRCDLILGHGVGSRYRGGGEWTLGVMGWLVSLSNVY